MDLKPRLPNLAADRTFASAYMLFHESFSALQWAGAAFVFIGIVLIALGH